MMRVPITALTSTGESMEATVRGVFDDDGFLVTFEYIDIRLSTDWGSFSFGHTSIRDAPGIEVSP